MQILSAVYPEVIIDAIVEYATRLFETDIEQVSAAKASRVETGNRRKVNIQRPAFSRPDETVSRSYKIPTSTNQEESESRSMGVSINPLKDWRSASSYPLSPKWMVSGSLTTTWELKTRSQSERMLP